MPPLRQSSDFERDYKRLTVIERRQVDAKLALLAENRNHPSLQARKWRSPNTWYARVSRDIRMYYELHDGYYLLTAVGHHDIERQM